MDVLIGLQWGDEGKGKIVDFLSPAYHTVARFQGGPNAGHTLEFDGIKHVLHQVPSGIFRPNTQNLIGSGVVLDLIILRKEIEAIEKIGVNVHANLYISEKAHLILPSHRLVDQAQERSKGDKKIGSTQKGIGPAYQDKIGRQGLRVGDLKNPAFLTKYNELKNKHLQILSELQFPADALPELEKQFFEAVEFCKKFNLVDSAYFVNYGLTSGNKILAEGAQGSMLDVDFGSYPFVTSSNTMVAGACTGLGVAPAKVGKVYGIFKAYCTRVGSGPFPTELFDETGETMRQIGREFGSTTGRPRRCGWLDLPALKYACMINGVTELFMMKADVLNTFDEIKICTHYAYADGSILDTVPYDIEAVDIKPVYTSFKGWNRDISTCSSFEELPEELADYIRFIEKHTELPVNIVSVGPNRSETIFKNIEVLNYR